jgi:adenylate cyclase class IV
MIEVEVKCELLPTSWPRLREQLATMHLTSQVTNVDTYYDTPSFDLLRQAVFVRVRNQQHLEFKWNAQADPAHLQCTERVFPMTPDSQQIRAMNGLFNSFLPEWRPIQTIEEAFQGSKLKSLAHIENSRALYHDNDLAVCVDHVENLGDFVEIELQCPENSDTHHAKARIRDLASRLAARHVRVGYVELWLQKYNPLAYQLGRYRL